jgi:hypothetical protein
MEKEKDFYKQILHILPSGWDQKVKELGALQRGREIKTAGELLRMILIYLTEGKSFAGTSALLKLSSQIRMSKVAVFKRMRNSAQWLRWLCENIYQNAGLLAQKPRWLRKKTVVLVDATQTVKSGAQKQKYLLHYSLELFTLSLREFLLTEESTGEKLQNFKDFGPQDIVMADRAYGTVPGISYLKSRGVGYVLRIQSRDIANAVYTKKKEKIELFEQLSGLAEREIADISAYCEINGQREKIRLCAMRKDAQSETEGLERLKRSNQRQCGGKAVTDEQRRNNRYIILVTSFGKKVSAEQVLELYRMRWQIEIAFKRLKSIFEYNELPARHSESVRAWFYGKLLLAALCETLVNTGRFSPSQDTQRG